MPLFITEGSKKADSAVSHGLCCVSLSGVWNWRGRNEHGGIAALPAWQGFAFTGRRVVLAFDSDASRKPGVGQALRTLGGYLQHKKAIVGYLHLPDDDEAKTGLDDYLAAHGRPGYGNWCSPRRPH